MKKDNTVNRTHGNWVMDGSLIIGAVKADEYDGTGGLVICDFRPNTEYPTPSGTEQIANGKFIVKAVNNHDKLVEALKIVSEEYNHALKIIAEAGGFQFSENNVIIDTKNLLKELDKNH